MGDWADEGRAARGERRRTGLGAGEVRGRCGGTGRAPLSRRSRPPTIAVRRFVFPRMTKVFIHSTPPGKAEYWLHAAPRRPVRTRPGRRRGSACESRADTAHVRPAPALSSSARGARVPRHPPDRLHSQGAVGQTSPGRENVVGGGDAGVAAGRQGLGRRSLQGRGQGCAEQDPRVLPGCRGGMGRVGRPVQTHGRPGGGRGGEGLPTPTAPVPASTGRDAPAGTDPGTGRPREGHRRTGGHQRAHQRAFGPARGRSPSPRRRRAEPHRCRAAKPGDDVPDRDGHAGPGGRAQREDGDGAADPRASSSASPAAPTCRSSCRVREVHVNHR